MYSFVRLFDKKKMEYYYANWKESNSFKYERKIKKDCFDADKQTSMVNKLVDMTTITTQSGSNLTRKACSKGAPSFRFVNKR